MQQKLIAIGVVVVVALAAVGGGIALVANSNDDNSNNDHKIPDVTGKWNLAYTEMATLCNEDGTPITDAKDVDIIDRHTNPYEPVATLEINKVGDHVISGKFIYKKESIIHGTLNGGVVKFSITNDEGYLFLYEVVPKGEYISCSLTSVKVPSGTDDHTIICEVGYMLFIRDGGNPVPIRSDYFDMSIMKAWTHIKSTLHKVTDFTEGKKTGKGTETDTGLTFSHAHNMISVFNVTSGTPDNNIGVQAVVTMGATPNNTVGGNIAGNMLPLDGANVNTTFIGYMFVSNGKAAFIAHIHNEGATSPEFAEMEYNVPYNKGGDLKPVYLSSEHEYKGTLVVKTKDKEPDKIEITKKFAVYDNTFYSETTKDGKKIIWFGEIYGHKIDIHVVNESLNEIGRLTGHIDLDYKIHIFGIMNGSDGKPASFLEYTLELVK